MPEPAVGMRVRHHNQILGTVELSNAINVKVDVLSPMPMKRGSTRNISRADRLKLFGSTARNGDAALA